MEACLVETRTILIAVADGVLADSLRFSLELEGFEATLCDERSLLPVKARSKPGCLVLDQDVFARMADGKRLGTLAELCIPIVLMVGQPSPRLLERARAAGVTRVVEKPLLGGMLSDAVKHALDDVASGNRAQGCC
jgi:FixJ family two-component response regulator